MAAGTRGRLIAAAFAVVARDGLEAASVKAIAREAGVTPGLLHYHFPSKDALIEAAMRDAVTDYLGRQSAVSDITELFQSARGTAESDQTYFKLRLALAAKAITDRASAKVMADVNAPAIEATAAALARANGEPVGPQHRDLAATLKACFDGVMMAWLLNPDFPLDRAGELLEKAVTSALAPTRRS